jgi:uncharacterized protein (DUF983 family)
MNSPKRVEYLIRGLTNRCPACGTGRVLKSLFHRYDRCPHCKMDFCREDGFYSGAMAINYALVCGFYLFPLLLIWWAGWLSGLVTIILSFLGSGLIPILTYRYSQSLWLGFYCCVTSEGPDEEKSEDS